MLSISYNDTQAAKNNSNHAVQIYNYIFSNSVSTHDQPVLNFIVVQHFYTVKLKIVNMKISSLNNMNIGIIKCHI